MGEWLDILEIGPECNERFVAHTKTPEIKSLDILLSGVSELKGNYQVGRSAPACNTIFYIVDGAVELYTEAGHQTVEKCHIITLPANKPYLIKLQSSHFSMVWFDLKNTKRWSKLCSNRPSVAICDSTKQIFHALSFIYYEKSESLRKPVLTHLEHYLETTLCATSIRIPEFQRLDQLIRDIEKKLHFHWTVADMAKLVNYSVPHLHRLFQKRFNRSPLQHVIFLRMERAKYLLVQTGWSIDQIAEQVGYSDVFNFSKRFKKSIGIPPGKFRKNEMEKNLLVSLN